MWQKKNKGSSPSCNGDIVLNQPSTDKALDKKFNHEKQLTKGTRDEKETEKKKKMGGELPSKRKNIGLIPCSHRFLPECRPKPNAEQNR